jgi:2-oxoglutarate dehydrogenase complex dehydrogenase (E1) component-like enzyme
MPDERTATDTSRAEGFGPNAWLVDEMYERYRDDPSSVSESWREFFTDYQSDTEAGAGAGFHVAQPATGRKGGSEAAPASPPPAPPNGATQPAAAESEAKAEPKPRPAPTATGDGAEAVGEPCPRRQASGRCRPSSSK